MAIELNNSVFIHVPKTGGRTVTNLLFANCEDVKRIGKPLDGHNTPDIGNKIAFAFVREPAMFCHSLWHHRSRKKFNWQNYLRLEKECGSKNYDNFMKSCGEKENLVIEYYQYYLSSYKKLLLGKTENLNINLIDILEHCKEKFNKDDIKNSNIVIGKNPKNVEIRSEVRLKINEMNNFDNLSGNFI